MFDEPSYYRPDRFWEWVSENRQRVIVLAVLVVVPFAVWMLVQQSHQRDQLDAIARIEATGAVIGGDGERHFYGVNWSRCSIGDQEMALLDQFVQFDHVDIGHTRVTDAGLVHLGGLRGLQALYLPDTPVTDAGLAQLRELTHVRTLSLSGTKVTDAGLEHLRGMNQLEWLSLSRTGVTDAGLKQLQSLPRLRKLHLTGTAVTADAIAALKRDRPYIAINPKGDYEERDASP